MPQRFTTPLLLSLMLASCASTPSPSNVLPLTAASMQMNISPGRVESWRTSIAPNQPVSLLASFDRLQPSEEWKPLISVCLLETLADQEDVCLRIEPHPKQGTRALVTVVDWPD